MRFRVLLIAPSMSIVGGQAVQAERLLAQLRQEESIEVSFLPIDPRLPSAVGRIPYLRTLARLALFLPAMLLQVRRHEIIHIFTASYWSYTLWNLPAILAGRWFHKKVIVNYRSGEAEDHLTRWRSAVASLRLADAIVSPSEYLVDVFARFGLRSRAISNILDTSRFRYRPRAKLRPAFLTNRGLEPLYNVDCVLRAFQIIQQRYPEATLAIAHDGSCRPRLETLAGELGLRNTRFLGFVRHEEMPELYDQADIYLMSPDLDCTPGSIMECFASGLPVVATKAGGIPYMIEHERTGLLVDCGDYQALAACALRLLEDEQLARRISDNGRRECGRYQPEAVRTAWVRLYRELLGVPIDEAAGPRETAPRIRER